MANKAVWLFHAAILGVIGLSAFNFALAMSLILAAITVLYIWSTVHAARNPRKDLTIELFQHYVRRIKPNAPNADT